MSVVKADYEDYRLTCDACGEEADEVFEDFNEAVSFKKENGWKSVKDRAGAWHELCPSCATPDVVRGIKG
jgi:hypothetical protein